MKYPISKCVDLFSTLNLTQERSNTKTGEILKPLIIPADKAKAGYWLGRLHDKCESINKAFTKQAQSVKKEIGTPETEKDKDGNVVNGEDGKPKTIPNQFTIAPENTDKWNEAINGLLEVEEEISFAPLKYELFEGVELPAQVWKTLATFLSEPEK